jgi:cobalt-zinc-cadmium efflux system outer membrane protein
MVWTVGALTAFGLVGGLLAQEVKLAESLSLNRATSMAISNSPQIKQVQWDIEKAKGQQLQQSRLVNPTVGTIANEIGNEGQAGQYGVFIQRNIVRNNRVYQIQNAYQWRIKSLESSSEVTQRSIAQEIGRQFIDIACLEQSIALQRELLTDSQIVKRFTESLVNAGEIAPLVLSRIEIDLEKQNQSISQLQLEKQKLLRSLETYFGEVSISDIQFDLSKEKLGVVKNFKPMTSADIQTVLELHPQLRVLRNEIEFQSWFVQVARSKQQPDLQVQSIVNYDMGTDDFFAGFQVNIPWMTNDRKLGGIAAARAQVHSTTEKLNQTKLALIRRMTELSIEIDNLKRRISSVESRTFPLVERNLAETMAVFRAGEASYIAVRDAIDLKFETRRQLNADTKSLLLGAIQLETVIVE